MSDKNVKPSKSTHSADCLLCRWEHTTDVSLSIRELVQTWDNSWEIHSSKGIGRQGKRTSDELKLRTYTLSWSFSHELSVPVEILCPQSHFSAHASHHWGCYHHTAHSTSFEVRVLSGRWIVAHPWPVLKGDWGRRISTGTDSSWLKLHDRV